MLQSGSLIQVRHEKTLEALETKPKLHDSCSYQLRVLKWPETSLSIRFFMFGIDVEILYLFANSYCYIQRRTTTGVI